MSSVSNQVPQGECVPEADAAGEAENDRGREHTVLEEAPEGPDRVRGVSEYPSIRVFSIQYREGDE